MVRKHSANYRGETAYIMGIKCCLYCCGLDVDQEKQMVLYYVILPVLFIGLIYDNFATVSERETIKISRSEKALLPIV